MKGRVHVHLTDQLNQRCILVLSHGSCGSRPSCDSSSAFGNSRLVLSVRSHSCFHSCGPQYNLLPFSLFQGEEIASWKLLLASVLLQRPLGHPAPPLPSTAIYGNFWRCFLKATTGIQPDFLRQVVYELPEALASGEC